VNSSIECCTPRAAGRDTTDGSAFSTTEWSGGVNPVSVVVTFTNADGTTTQKEAACA
jgi:hypothetical protein